MSFSIANRPHQRGYCANDVVFLAQSRDVRRPCGTFCLRSSRTGRPGQSLSLPPFPGTRYHAAVPAVFVVARIRSERGRPGLVFGQSPFVACRSKRIAAVASTVNRPRLAFVRTTVPNSIGSPHASALTRTGCCVCLFAVRKSSTTSFCTVRPCTHRRQFGFVFEFPFRGASRCMRTFRLTALAVSKTLGPSSGATA